MGWGGWLILIVGLIVAGYSVTVGNMCDLIELNGSITFRKAAD
jgi:hypothetical protein